MQKAKKNKALRAKPPVSSGKTGGKRQNGKKLGGKKLALIIAAVLLAAAIIAGLALFLTRDKAVITVGDLTVTEDLYAYWLHYYRYEYRKNLAIASGKPNEDSDAFWASLNQDGITHEAAARAYAEERMIKTLAAAALYEETVGSLSDGLRAEMQESLDRALAALGCESKREYNKLAREYGFDYSTLRRALLYTTEARLIESILLGSEGANLTDGDVEDYYEANFVRVLWLELPTEQKIMLDSYGNPMLDDYGDPILLPMTPDEIDASYAAAAAIESAMAASSNTLDTFRELSASYNQDYNRFSYPTGYYLDPRSGFTAALRTTEDGKRITNAAFGLTELGDWVKIEFDTRIIFLYRAGTETMPYSGLDENDPRLDFFHDLKQNAAPGYFERLITLAAGDAETKRELADSITSPRIEDGIPMLDFLSFYLVGETVGA